MKFCIVDDSDAFRKGLNLFLTLKLNREIIAEARSGEKALQLTNIYDADIILMDIKMGNLDGFETANQILLRHPQINIIALSMHKELIFLTKLIRAGFKAYVAKRDYYLKLPLAINAVMKGDFFFQETIKT